MMCFPDYSIKKSRFRSLICFKDPPVRIETLANNGFYSRSFDSNIIQCHECDLTLSNFEKGDRPKKLHMIFAPHCSYAKPEGYDHYLRRLLLEPGNNSPEEVDDSATTGPEAGEGGEASGQDPKTENPLSFIHPEYKHYLKRRESFSDGPKEIQQKQCKFAASGFFLSKETEMVQCYACGLTITYWLPISDPWELHVKYYPDCYHLMNDSYKIYQSRLMESQL